MNRAKKISVIIGLIFILLIVIFYSLNLGMGQKEGFSDTKTLEKNVIHEFNTDQLEESKMRNFITSKLHETNVFLDFQINSTSGDMDPKEFPMKMLYAGLQEKNADMMISAFTIEALNRSWGNEVHYEVKIDRISNFINMLTKNGTLKTVSYAFMTNQYGIEEDNGKMLFKYVDGEVIQIPFQLQIQEEDHREMTYYLISTSLVDMENAINKVNN